jgi:tryptophan synthase alpha chain
VSRKSSGLQKDVSSENPGRGFCRGLSSKLLIPYLVAGDPDLHTTARYLRLASGQGIFAVELGIPFSDPTADGLVIQEASQRALRHETALREILDWLTGIPKEFLPPIYLMTYFNLFHHMGIESFCRQAKKSGRINGVVIPDLSFEDAADYRPVFRKYGINLVGFVSPTTGLSRARKIVKESRGFIYYVGLMGTTGSDLTLTENMRTMVQQLRKWTDLPVCVGFGISKPEMAEEVLKFSDGVIVGSRLVSEECSPEQWERSLSEFSSVVRGGSEKQVRL